MLQYILDEVFRSNPNYELVVFDRLLPAESTLIEALTEDSDFYGILRPKHANLGAKSISCDTALLFLTLQEPGVIPHYVRAKLAAKCNETIAKMVLDEVLQISVNHAFVAGSDAHTKLYTNAAHRSANTRHALAQLSAEALFYAQALAITESHALSERLYFFNHLPITPFWRRLIPSSDAFHTFIDPSGATFRLLEKHWATVDGNASWLMWSSRERVKRAPRTHKLYISPQPRYIPEVFQPIVEILTQNHVPVFKIGNDLHGILRADKFVAYFATLDEVKETARQLAMALAGVPAQGVPFTASLTDDSLLSWGMDPPRHEHRLAWQGPSWRRWVTDRLAVALITARGKSNASIEPWQFALERLSLEGIDTDTWTPTATIWENL